MAGYFEEHNCAPLPDGTAPDALLQFARQVWTATDMHDKQ